MSDRKQVNEWLEGMAHGGAEWCAHYSDTDCQRLAKEALALMKEQEAVTPKENAWVIECGNCGYSVGYYAESYVTGLRLGLEKECKFCPDCGRKVKWE